MTASPSPVLKESDCVLRATGSREGTHALALAG